MRSRFSWIALTFALLVVSTAFGDGRLEPGREPAAPLEASEFSTPLKIRGTAAVGEEDRFFAVLVAESRGRTSRGTFASGDVLDPNATVLEGVFRNQSGSSIEILDAAGRSLVILDGSVGVIVADLEFCKVRCKRGYFACCEEGWFANSCRCLPQGESDEVCGHGGAGASFCAVGGD